MMSDTMINLFYVLPVTIGFTLNVMESLLKIIEKDNYATGITLLS